MYYSDQIQHMRITYVNTPPVNYVHFSIPLANSTPIRYEHRDEVELELQEKRRVNAAKREELAKETQELRQMCRDMTLEWQKMASEREEIDRECKLMNSERLKINLQLHAKHEEWKSERMKIAQERKEFALERKKMEIERVQFALERGEMARKRKAVNITVPGSIQVFCANEQPVQKRIKVVKSQGGSNVEKSLIHAPVLIKQVNNYTLNFNAPVKLQPVAPKRRAAIKANKKLAMINED
ncbi:hypothetical protein ACKWTF_004778 [Chironomus riparius]